MKRKCVHYHRLFSFITWDMGYPSCLYQKWTMPFNCSSKMLKKHQHKNKRFEVFFLAFKYSISATENPVILQVSLLLPLPFRPLPVTLETSYSWVLPSWWLCAFYSLYHTPMASQYSHSNIQKQRWLVLTGTDRAEGGEMNSRWHQSQWQAILVLSVSSSLLRSTSGNA